MGDRLKLLFSIDTRALAVVRIGLAVLLLTELFLRLPWFVEFHTSAGFLPLHSIKNSLLQAGFWSVYFFDDRETVQMIWFGLTGLFAVQLLVGYRTQLAAILCWVLFYSLCYRAPLVLTSADTWLRVGLLWGIFLPLGACWSIDGRRCIGKPKSETYFSAATVIILLQITLLWMIAGWAKFAEPLWVNGEAIYYATQLDSLATRWTPLLRANFEWTQWLTWAISFSEVLSPLLLFVVPLLIGVWFRTVAVLLLAIIYSLLAVFLDLRLDSYIHVVFVLLFVPRPVWTLLCGAGRPTADRLRQELNLVRQGKGKFRRLGSVDCGRSKSAALLVGLLLSVYPQLNKVIDQTAVPYRAEIQKISNALGFAVGYDFLVPGPSRTEKFWFFLGTLKNGSTVDAFRGSPAALTVGRDPVSMRPGVHWLRVFPDFYARLYSPDLRKRFIRVLCNRWKQKYPVGPMANLKTIRFRIIEDVSALPGGVAIKPIVTGKGILHKCR